MKGKEKGITAVVDWLSSEEKPSISVTEDGLWHRSCVDKELASLYFYTN